MNEITEITEIEAKNLPAVTAGPLSMAIQAMKSGMSIADMKGMLELQKDWEANEARKAYVADMAEFKKNPPEIFKRKQVNFTSRDGDTTSYQHATIGDVTSLTVEGLAKHGFSHRWDMQQQDGHVVVTCILTHRLGHSESTTLMASPDTSGKKNAIQQMASSVTYLQRYTLLAAAGLATKDMEDDDGKATSDQYDAEGVLQEWSDRANAAINLLALNDTRKMAGVEFSAAKDVVGWNAFKLVVEAKRKALTEAA